VVLEAVPDGATMVGIPARIVRCRDANEVCLELVKDQAREKGIEPSAFEAYGVDAEMMVEGDPVEELRAEIAQLREELEAVRVAHESLDTRCG